MFFLKKLETAHYNGVKYNPVCTQRHLNAHTTLSQRYGRYIDVKTTLFAYREADMWYCIRVMCFQVPPRLVY